MALYERLRVGSWFFCLHFVSFHIFHLSQLWVVSLSMINIHVTWHFILLEELRQDYAFWVPGSRRRYLSMAKNVIFRTSNDIGILLFPQAYCCLQKINHIPRTSKLRFVRCLVTTTVDTIKGRNKIKIEFHLLSAQVAVISQHFPAYILCSFLGHVRFFAGQERFWFKMLRDWYSLHLNMT